MISTDSVRGTEDKHRKERAKRTGRSAKHDHSSSQLEDSDPAPPLRSHSAENAHPAHSKSTREVVSRTPTPGSREMDAVDEYEKKSREATSKELFGDARASQDREEEKEDIKYCEKWLQKGAENAKTRKPSRYVMDKS